jgi:hypothetical protein
MPETTKTRTRAAAPKKLKNWAKKTEAPEASEVPADTAPVLPIIAGAMLTAKGLRLAANLTLEEAYGVGKQLVDISRLGPWAWGDWQLEMERLGVTDAEMRKWIDAHHLTYQTLHNYKSLAKAFPHSRRREWLSIGHHEAVKELPVADADQLLMEAEAANMSRSDLRMQVALLRLPDDDKDDDDDDKPDDDNDDTDKDDDADDTNDDGDDDDSSDDVDDISIIELEPMTVEEIFVPLAEAIHTLHEVKRSKVHPKDLVAYLRRQKGKKKKVSISATAEILSRVIRQPGDNLTVVLRRFLAPLVELGKQLEAEQRAERKQAEAERKQAEAEQVANVVPFR